MGIIRQKLKDGLRAAESKVLKLEGKLKAKIKAKLQYIKARLKAERQMVKTAYLWVKGKLWKEDRQYDIRKSLRRLKAQAFWPKSVMEKYYQQEILPLVGDNAGLRHYAIVKGLRALPKVARGSRHGKPAFSSPGITAAHDFFAGLLDTAKKSAHWTKCWFVVEGAEAFPALAKADPELAVKLFKGMLEVAGDNQDLRCRTYDALIGALPVLAKYDNKLKPVTPALVAELRTALGEDPKQPVVYRELAVSPANPASGHASVIIPGGSEWWRETYVSAGCFTGLSSAFVEAVNKKYPYNSKTPGRAHYDVVARFLSSAFNVMSKQPSLRDAIHAKIKGTAPVAGTAWPGNKYW